MKIVHVISGLTKGGAERVAVELANIAVKNGDDVVIIAGWRVDPIFLQNSINPKISVLFIGKSKNTAYLNIIPWIFKNRKWLCSYDVLHCHLTFGAVFGSVVYFLMKIIFRKKRPIIVETNHAVGMSIPKLNRWLHSQMLLFRDGLVLMAKDNYWDNFVCKHPNLKTELISNGIAVVEMEKSEAEKIIFRKEIDMKGHCEYLVGTVGMLRPDRKPWLYIPIFKEIQNALGTKVYFILAGGGTEFENLKTLVIENGLSEYIYMPGLVNNPRSFINHMDIYVSLSVGATTGISMVEAAMCKVPVVGIQMDEKYVTKNEDWVWSNSDTDEVAKKIVALLKNEEERKALAIKQYDFANNNFNSKAMYTAYNLFYKKIIAN